MGRKKKKEIEPSKITKYIIRGCIIVAIIILNYWYWDKYLSANSKYVTNYQAKEDVLAQYRNPAVAGLFYMAQPEKLSKNVEQYIQQSGEFKFTYNHYPKMLIVPHAGYEYSAGAAGKAYATLQGAAAKIKKVLLVGPSHFYGGQGAFLSDIDYFSTPLGDVKVNKQIVKQLAAENKQFNINNQAHLKEHSIEVQLPFIQKVLPQAEIIPIIYGNIAPEELSKGLQKYLMKEDTILIVSADLSHYYQYNEAVKIDTETAKKINKGKFLDDHESCGSIGINAALILAKNSNYRPQMLELINSGDSQGDKSRVVGYGAWSFYPDEVIEKPSKLEKETENLQDFSNLYKDMLMQIAQESLVKAVKHHKHYSPSRSSFPEDLFDKGAVFVTLHKNGELRGCIGNILPTLSVAQGIANNAYAAALEDNRFSPVTEDELPEITFSISLLTNFERINYINEQDVLKQIKSGKDGIVIRDGNRQGVFLPAVWEQLRDKTEFFKQLKIKAGMNPNYWNNGIKVYRFRAVEITDEN